MPPLDASASASRPATPTVRTSCPYCGVGCGVAATPDGVGGAVIAGDPRHPANAGRLCSKGSALGQTLSLVNGLGLVATFIDGQDQAAIGQLLIDFVGRCREEQLHRTLDTILVGCHASEWRP